MPAGRAEPAAGMTLDIASTFPGSMPILGDAAHSLADRISRASGGEMMLKFYEPGALVPAAETVNAVSPRRPFRRPGPAPAGSPARRQRVQHVLLRPVRPGYRRIHGLDVSRRRPGDGARDVPPQRRAQHSLRHDSAGSLRLVPQGDQQLADLNGLRMRFFGLGAKVMQKLGVATQQLPPGEILEALKSGALDATEFSLPADGPAARLL